MTSRERILAAIGHRPTDRAPMDFGGTMLSLCLPEFLDEMRNLPGYALPEDVPAENILAMFRASRNL